MKNAASVECRRKYRTPPAFGNLWMEADGEGLTGLWFEGSRETPVPPADDTGPDLPVFRETRRWLDVYFAGRDPGFTPALHVRGLTPFRREVMEAMLAVPFGQTTSYGAIAAAIAAKRGMAAMSAQAVGGAVGWNPVCIIVPCHRVVGAHGELTGYGGGLSNKAALLALEGVPFSRIP